MFFKTLTLMLSLATAVTPRFVKRDEGTKLYAYGKGISGFEVYAGLNGTAYIAASPSANLTELTWSSPSMDATWNVTANSTDPELPVDTGRVFYIINSDTVYEPCGFKSPNETLPTDASITGFFLFGKQAFWSDGSSYEAQFWAKATGETDLYTLNWNKAGIEQTGSVPVTLKTTAPATLDRSKHRH
ncbi:hypothetical protein INS49_009252 [Diaporthe citri]|uniref:uncharacterized protein n=1 Tax=Diaporthe citri TaxID=83186 RepID=UPI001C81D0E2|nr:uncharacterized protein INS49_009252 [Diaporthe citri]KAG6361033.1 hypothetical protein INS49_009252 [Diaporthe citri]